MGRPSRIFGRKKKDGTRPLDPTYKAYLRDLVRITPCERKEWGLLGVHLTKSKEANLMGVYDLYDDIEMLASM
jgi:hypothetical protein